LFFRKKNEDTGKIRAPKAVIREVRVKSSQSFRDNPGNQGMIISIRVVEPDVRRGFLLTILLA
jgi:hypothetical protein